MLKETFPDAELRANNGPTIGLLVSVRNADEALDAWCGGAAVIDIKEPRAGPLGRSAPDDVSTICQLLPANVLITAAMGEASQFLGESAAYQCALPKRLSAVKFGPSGFGKAVDYLAAITRCQEMTTIPCVCVAYADHLRASSPPVGELLALADPAKFPWFLIDTFEKDGCGLFHWISKPILEGFCRDWRSREGQIVLAGSIKADDLEMAAICGPDLIAVRGAACRGGREGTVDRELVANLVRIGDFGGGRITLKVKRN